MLKQIHKPSDFKVGTIFVGDVNFRKCEIVNIYHEKYIDIAGNVRYKDYLTVAFKSFDNGRIYSTDMETLCRIKITIITEE